MSYGGYDDPMTEILEDWDWPESMVGVKFRTVLDTVCRRTYDEVGSTGNEDLDSGVAVGIVRGVLAMIKLADTADVFDRLVGALDEPPDPHT